MSGETDNPAPPASAPPTVGDKGAKVPIWRKFEVLGSVVVGAFIVFFTYSQVAIQQSQEQTASKQAVASLIIALAEEDDMKREMAAIGLANLGEGAIDPLILALGGTEPTTQDAAIDALVNISELYGRAEVANKLKTRFGETTSANTLDNYIAVLEEIKGLYVLIDDTKIVNAFSFRKVIDLYGKNLDHRNLNKILKKRDVKPETQKYVIKTIGSIARPARADAVREAVRETVRILVNFSLGHHDKDVRVASIQNLALLASRAALPEADRSEVRRAILKMLDERSDRLVLAAIDESGIFCGDEAIRDKLRKIVDQSMVELVRKTAKNTLNGEDCSVD